MQVGDRIYYTGDMANNDGEGTVTSVDATTVDIAMDDGREFRRLWATAFNPGLGRRFWLLDEWVEFRRRELEESQRRIMEMLARQKKEG